MKSIVQAECSKPIDRVVNGYAIIRKTEEGGTSDRKTISVDEGGEYDTADIEHRPADYRG